MRDGMAATMLSLWRARNSENWRPRRWTCQQKFSIISSHYLFVIKDGREDCGEREEETGKRKERD